MSNTVTIIAYPVRKSFKSENASYYQTLELVQSPAAPNQTIYRHYYSDESRALEPGTYTANVCHYARDYLKKTKDGSLKPETVLSAFLSDFVKIA
jgi:hypothetical protein